MQITIIRSQEPTKGLLGSKNVELGVEISISLSKKEEELISRYRDPYISISDLREFAGAEAFSPIKIEKPLGGEHLSKFRLVAHTDDGLKALGNMQTLVKAVISVVKDKLSYLEALGKWGGEEVISVE